MIQFRCVTKWYGKPTDRGRPALDKVSFSLSPGEIFGYIGPNGAGKTTTIRIIVGLIREFEGSIIIDNGKAPIHTIVGYMPQRAGFQEWRTVGHALRTFGLLSGIDPVKLPHRIDEVLDRIRLTEYRNTRIAHLSGGTVQRLSLAQAILHNPKVLVLDEPISGLDPAGRRLFKEIIQELADEQRLVFFSSHILSDIEDLATRIGILAQGHILRMGTPEELRQSFGVGQIIEVETAPAPATIDPALFAVGGILRSEALTDHLIRLHTDARNNLDETMRSVMRVCVDRSLPVRRIVHLHPSLEEIYLKLIEDGNEMGAKS